MVCAYVEEVHEKKKKKPQHSLVYRIHIPKGQANLPL